MFLTDDLVIKSIIALISAGGAYLTMKIKSRINNMKSTDVDDMSNDIEKDIEVYNRLESTLNNVNCDRISLFQFHNGESFLETGNSFRKTSNTYEVTAAGISSEQKNLQALPITIYSPQIRYMVENSFLFIKDVNEANALYNTYTLKSSGVKSVYRVPIYTLSNQIMGFISAEWVKQNVDANNNNLLLLQETAAIISGYLYKYSKKKK